MESSSPAPFKAFEKGTAADRIPSFLPNNMQHGGLPNETHSALQTHTVVSKDEVIPSGNSNDSNQKKDGHVRNRKYKKDSKHQATYSLGHSIMLPSMINTATGTGYTHHFQPFIATSQSTKIVEIVPVSTLTSDQDSGAFTLAHDHLEGTKPITKLEGIDRSLEVNTNNHIPESFYVISPSIGDDSMMEEILLGIGSQFEACSSVSSINADDLLAMKGTLSEE
ncbi:uncharacterized protein LY89DRAFT_671672 [Mollisia scopiformis]|uniref:Uncharacterized protein n=1 Tax=Mollisia scopiformis TaxID=149040 RepID=A0A194X3A8_MOLSC|nr:uncharacterized protein LY89DRAFT_671672 [Mollisia scopiformis]KUJ14307.1 hypothetical protein LY89DRAFT_671672 [Mollisia scopiformis]